jgi:hypothetical protein
LDGAVLEGAEPRCMSERGVEIVGGVAGAQNEDAPCLVSPDARGPGGEQPEEHGGTLAHALERSGELVEIDGALAAGRWMVAGGVELRARASRGELMARDAPEVGRVDEELALGDAHGHDVGHMLVGDGVPVTLPVDEAVDAAHAVGDARRVIRMAREGNEFALLLGEALETGVAVSSSQVDDGVEPRDELDAQVVQVAERTAVEERALELPEASLHAWLCIGVPAHGPGSELVVRCEREKARVVDGLGTLPPERDELLAVVRAALGAALEALERAHVPIKERVEVVATEDVEELPRAVGEDVRECLHGEVLTAGELDRVRGPVALGHLAGPVAGRCEARRGLVPWARRPHVSLDRGVAAVEPLTLEDLEHALRGDVRVAPEQLVDPASEGVDLLGARGVLRSRDRGMRAVALRLVRGEHRFDGVAADTRRPCDLPLRHPVR